MRRLLVLSLSASYALCLVVNPDLLTPIKTFGEACGYDACPVALSETGINVHIVPHTHYELGSERTFAQHYTGKEPPWAESKVSMKQTLDSVVTELYMQPHRRFSLADIPYFFHWWSQRDDTVRQMVYELIRQGRLVFIGGGWSMADEATPNYHAIIDSHTFSLRKINATFWKCGRPQVAWQADVMGHSREFASLAAQMGYDALFINPISFDDELARMRRWALEMLWRGSDDLGARSDIYTHKLYDGYWSPPGFCFSSLCTDPLIIHSDNVLSNVEERVKSFVDSMYNRQAPNYNTSHVMVMMGHVNGFFDASMWFSNIDVLINSVNARARKGMQNMYLFYSTPACFAKAVHDYNIVLETKQDDFFPIAYDKNSYITGFYTSCPSIKYQARIALIYLQMCKQMRVFAEIAPYYNKLYEELNWIVGAFHDHSIITGLLKDSVKSYYIEKQHTAVQRSTVLLKDAWNKLRKCPTDTVYYRCTFNQSQCHAIIGDTYFVQIYNPLAWRVTMPVRVPLQCFFYGFEVFDPQGNKVKSKTMAIPYPVMNLHTRTSKSNCEVVFIAEDLPPIGFRSYFIQRIPVEPEHSKVKRESTKMTNDEQEVINKLKVKREAIYKTKLKKEAGDKIKVESKASDDKKSKLKVVNKKKVKPEAIKDIKKIKQVTDKKMTIAIDREVKEVPEQPTVKRVTIKEKKVKAKAINKRGGKQDKTDCKNKFKQEVIDTRVARDKELETPMIKQNATKEKNDKLETTDTHATNEEKVQHKVTEEKEKAIDKRKLKLDTTNERKNNLGGAERPKITIIKQIYSKPMEHVNPKPNKKYLIRQINPATEDYEFIDYNDFIDYNLTVDTTTEISNVSVLLESDGEELKLQKIIGREDFPMMRQTVAPELVKAFPSTTMATSIVSDIDSDFGSDIEARHWGKVMISGKKGLDDIIHSLKPDRTSTAKSDKQIEANTTSLRQYFTDDHIEEDLSSRPDTVPRPENSRPGTPAPAAEPESASSIVMSQSQTHSEPVAGPSSAADIDLDADILQILGDAPEPENTLGAPIHKDVAARWLDIVKKGLSKEAKEQLSKDYLVPSNCQPLVPPILNPEAKAALTEPFIKRDSSLVYRQKQISNALSAIAPAIEVIISKECDEKLKRKLLKPISDACRVLCDMHHNETNIRRKFIISSVNTGLKDALVNSSSDKYLFGDNMTEKLKAAKTVQRSGESLKITQKLQKSNFIRNYNNKNRPNFKSQPQKTAGRQDAGRREFAAPRQPGNNRNYSAPHRRAPRDQTPPPPPPRRRNNRR